VFANFENPLFTLYCIRTVIEPLSHGARAEEIAKLRLQNTYFKNEQIHVHPVKGPLDSTQNLLKVRGNALFNGASALKAWLAVRKPDADDYVFNSQKSTQLNRATIYKLFKQIAKNAEVYQRTV
jgi:integrase